MARLSHFMEQTRLQNTFTYQTNTHSFEIRWAAFGEAHLPPLVFVHGTPWTSRVWAPYAATLSRHFRVHLFDNPGFGESPLGKPLKGRGDDEKKDGDDDVASSEDPVTLDANLAQQSEVFAALYKTWQEKEWNGRKAHVVVHDHAGIMSLRASLLHGCDYASLCLIDVVAMGPFGKDLFRLVAEQRETFESLPPTTFQSIVEGYVKDAAHHPLDQETMKVLVCPWMPGNEGGGGGQAGFVRQLRQANSRSTDGLEERYGEVGRKLPVKVIWGAEDKWIPVETATRLGRALNATEVTVVDDAGHLIMFDQGEALGVELTWWLSKVSAP